MRHEIETSKSVDQATTDLEAAVRRNGFGVLHQYDLKQTLASKGVNLPHECRIPEVCNPQHAVVALEVEQAIIRMIEEAT